MKATASTIALQGRLQRPLPASRSQLPLDFALRPSRRGVVANAFVTHYAEIAKTTQPGISIFDITPQVRQIIEESGVKNGTANVLSRHTTTAVSINENEVRLLDDIRRFLLRLAPPNDFYLHNDLHLREAPEDWPGGWKAWAEQEPENAHSHLLSMMLGNSESVPVTDGKLMLGTWQSLLLIELDGPRTRSVGVHIIGQI